MEMVQKPDQHQRKKEDTERRYSVFSVGVCENSCILKNVLMIY